MGRSIMRTLQDVSNEVRHEALSTKPTALSNDYTYGNIASLKEDIETRTLEHDLEDATLKHPTKAGKKANTAKKTAKPMKAVKKATTKTAKAVVSTAAKKETKSAAKK